MDWGFLESNDENTLLREEIVYSYPIYYYLAILQDVFLRFAWSIEFYLKSSGKCLEALLDRFLDFQKYWFKIH